MIPYAFDLDTHEDEVRLVLDGEFEAVQLRDNPAKLVKIGVELHLEVKAALIECLQDDTYLFDITPHYMPNIDPSVACHQLNVASDARYVSHRWRKQIPREG